MFPQHGVGGRKWQASIFRRPPATSSLDFCPFWVFDPGVLQIVFNEISAAEISRLGTLEQLELLDAFKVTEADLKHLDTNLADDGQHLGKMVRDGKTLYRFRTKDYRIYFEVVDGCVIVHRVLNKNTFSDFMFRSKMPLSEDEELSQSKHFWKLIDEGRNARRM